MKTQEIDYTYDMFNNLIGRVDTTYNYDGSIATQTAARCVYDLSAGNMVLAFDGTGALTDRFLWGPATNQILADEQVTSTSTPGQEKGTSLISCPVASAFPHLLPEP